VIKIGVHLRTLYRKIKNGVSFFWITLYIDSHKKPLKMFLSSDCSLA